MPIGLLLECDEQVAAWYSQVYQAPQIKVDRAVGLVKGSELVGAVIFHYGNGSNIEVSYYGPQTMSPGIVRYIAFCAVNYFDVSRLTVLVSKRNKALTRSLLKLGFKLEGAQRCYYGKADTIRNTAIRLVMFRDRLDQIAGKKNVTTTASGV